MEQIERFNLAVTTITVAIMFLVLEYVAPMLQSPVMVKLLIWLPFLSVDQIAPR